MTRCIWKTALYHTVLTTMIFTSDRPPRAEKTFSRQKYTSTPSKIKAFKGFKGSLGDVKVMLNSNIQLPMHGFASMSVGLLWRRMQSHDTGQSPGGCEGCESTPIWSQSLRTCPQFWTCFAEKIYFLPESMQKSPLFPKSTLKSPLSPKSTLSKCRPGNGPVICQGRSSLESSNKWSTKRR